MSRLDLPTTQSSWRGIAGEKYKCCVKDCPNEFVMNDEGNKKYCSKECVDSAMKIIKKHKRTLMQKVEVCQREGCEGTFIKRNIQKYCSKKCSKIVQAEQLKARLEQKKKNGGKQKIEEKKCKNCEITFKPLKNTTFYCSRKCQVSFNSKSRDKRFQDFNKHEKVCRVCGNVFETTKSHQKMCSKDCYAIMQLKQARESRKRRNEEKARKEESNNLTSKLQA